MYINDRNLDIIRIRAIKLSEKFFKKSKNKYKIVINNVEHKKIYSHKNDKYFIQAKHEFISILKENNICINKVNNDLNDVIFINFFEQYIPTFINGFYYLNFNMIVNFNNKSEEERNDTIIHELFHAISSKKYGSGFMSRNYTKYNFKSKIIGRELNEGYTELLNMRYFHGKFCRSYPIDVFIANKIEYIIGKDKMEQLYFDANLPGLINEMQKYIDDEKIKILLQNGNFLKKILIIQEMYMNKCERNNILLNQEYIESLQQTIELIFSDFNSNRLNSYNKIKQHDLKVLKKLLTKDDIKNFYINNY